MKTRFIAPIALAALLLLSAIALARSDDETESTLWYIKQESVSGGDYNLTSVNWQVSGATNGEGYRLVAPLSPAGTGTPCCCNYLPCVLHN